VSPSRKTFAIDRDVCDFAAVEFRFGSDRRPRLQVTKPRTRLDPLREFDRVADWRGAWSQSGTTKYAYRNCEVV
jgi:hypothetical protein